LQCFPFPAIDSRRPARSVAHPATLTRDGKRVSPEIEQASHPRGHTAVIYPHAKLPREGSLHHSGALKCRKERPVHERTKSPKGRNPKGEVRGRWSRLHIANCRVACLFPQPGVFRGYRSGLGRSRKAQESGPEIPDRTHLFLRTICRLPGEWEHRRGVYRFAKPHASRLCGAGRTGGDPYSVRKTPWHSKKPNAKP
jgi:hypothetical protein